MTDKATDKARSKTALKMILAGHIKKGRSIVEAKLQTSANDPAVLR